jgi:hypothetical protein
MLTLGAAIGGVITGWFDTDVAFILDAATYLLSAWLIASIRVQKRRKKERPKLTVGRALGITETIEGIRYVKERPRVLALLLVKPAWGVGGGILTLLAVFGERIFPVGKSAATGIGVLFAARGIGTAFGTSTSFILALFMLGIAHCGGSILWVFSTVMLQRGVADNFRGRVFAAELALLTLTMAASNYTTGELLDRFNISPRLVTVGIGIFFLLPGLVWFLTQRQWDRDVRKLPYAN